MPSKEPFRLSPSARGALFYFGLNAASAADIPFISIFFAHRGFSGSEIGVLAAVGPLTALIVGPGLAAVADRRGWRVRLLCIALASAAVIILLVPLSPSFLGLILIMVALSAVASPIGPIGDGLVAGMAARRGLSYGRMRLWGSLSWAVMSAFGGALWQSIGLVFIFPVAGILFLATIPFARLLEEHRSTQSSSRPPLRTVMRDLRLRIVLFTTLILGLALNAGLTFSGIYLDKLSGGQLLVGLFAGVTALCELPAMHWSDSIMRRLGGLWTLALSYALYGASYLGLAFIKSPALLLGAAVIQGIGFGLFLPVTVRLVAGWTHSEWSSTAQGILSAGLWSLAPLIAGPLGGAIYDSAGPSMVFVVCAGVTLIGIVVLGVSQLAGVFNRSAEHGGMAESVEAMLSDILP